jgi:DnaJ-domain-containing protein 1
VRLRVGARQLLGWLGGRQQIPRLRPDRADDLSSWANALDLSGWERQVLEDLDGHRSLGELLEGIARAVDLLALVYVLHVFEIIDLLGEPLITDKSGRDPAELDRTRIEARLRLIHDSDYFAVLGVERTANAIDIRRAYRDLTTTFADDRLEPQTLRSYGDALRELRAALDEAYFVLSDEALRSTYLAHLEEP